jgi:hypothetical protein
MDSFFSEYVAHELQFLGETSLLPQARITSTETYRFVWLRSFDPPISVRLEVLSDESGILTEKIGSGEAGFVATQHGTVQSSKLALTREQVEWFRAVVTKEHFWTTPPYAFHDQQGTDGSSWIIEALVAGTYHIAQRWSPADSTGSGKETVKQLGMAMAFDLARLPIPKDKIY